MTNFRVHLPEYVSAAVLIAVMFLFSLHTLTSVYQDIGRHLTLGQMIWQTHHVPVTNLFSYTAKDFPFIDHHWLAEVLLYLGNRVVGLEGLIAAKALLVALAFGLALGAAWRPRMAVVAMVAGLISVLVMVERTDVRPEILSFVFLGWYLFVCYRLPYSRLVWTLPLVQLLWVNSHIYFFMGPFILLAWWAGEIAQHGMPALKNKRTWALAAAIALGTLANPHGWYGAVYPLQIFSNYGYSIVENQTPFFLRAFGYPQMTSLALYLGMVLVAASFVVNRKYLRANIMSLILAGATAVLALVMIRNFPLFALVMLPVTLRNLDQAGWYVRNRNVLTGGLVILALFGISVATNQIYDQAGISGRQFGLRVPQGPQAPVDFFKSAGLKGPLFNNFDVGSFLIWQLPQEPVFIDGRPEAYPADFIQNVYIKMQEDAVSWEKYSAQYRVNTIFWDYQDITPWSQTFLARISKDPMWVPVYRANSIVIYIKNVPANRDIIGAHRLIPE